MIKSQKLNAYISGEKWQKTMEPQNWWAQARGHEWHRNLGAWNFETIDKSTGSYRIFGGACSGGKGEKQFTGWAVEKVAGGVITINEVYFLTMPEAMAWVELNYNATMYI